MFFFTIASCLIAELILIHIFNRSIFRFRNPPTGVTLFLYACFGLPYMLLSLLFSGIVWKLLFLAPGIASLTVLLFETGYPKAFLASIIYCALYALAELLIQLLLPVYEMNIAPVYYQSTSHCITLVISRLLLLAFLSPAAFLRLQKNAVFTKHTLLPLVPCWMITMLLCVLLIFTHAQIPGELHPLYAFVVTGFLYLNILIVLLMKLFRDQARAKQQAELTEQYYLSQKNYYEQLHAQQDEIRRIWHDIQKYLRAVTADGVTDPANPSMRQIRTTLDDVVRVVDVDNIVISVILNDYARRAHREKIPLLLDVQVIPDIAVSTVDLYVILGNTLDNAFDACAELPEAQRKINLQLRMHNRILFYRISNPYPPGYHDRSRGLNHGYGLENAVRCVDRYRGFVDVEQKDGLFTFSAHLNCE